MSEACWGPENLERKFASSCRVNTGFGLPCNDKHIASLLLKVPESKHVLCMVVHGITGHIDLVGGLHYALRQPTALLHRMCLLQVRMPMSPARLLIY